MEPGGQPDLWRRGADTGLATEARLFGAAVRTAFARLVAGSERITGSGRTAADAGATLRVEWKQRLQPSFGRNSPYTGGAIL